MLAHALEQVAANDDPANPCELGRDDIFLLGIQNRLFFPIRALSLSFLEIQSNPPLCLPSPFTSITMPPARCNPRPRTPCAPPVSSSPATPPASINWVAKLVVKSNVGDNPYLKDYPPRPDLFTPIGSFSLPEGPKPITWRFSAWPEPRFAAIPVANA
jgi:hypothetical protein